MLDIKFIQKNKEEVKKAVKVKDIDLDVDELLEVYKKRNQLLVQIEQLRKKRNELSKKAGQTSSKEDFLKYREENRRIKEELKKLEEKYRKVEKEYQEKMLLVPNIPSQDTPIGKDPSDNKVVSFWGKVPQFKFSPRSHIELGEKLDLIDFQRGVRISGFRGYYLKNEAVLMQIGLMWFALKKLEKKGYKLFIPPVLVKEFALIGSGHFPFGKEDIFQIANPEEIKSEQNLEENSLFLAGTSEPSLLAYFANEVLDEKDLPVKVCGFSPCYRSEVGSYGKDAKGLYRLHEFMKVEQVVLCKNDLKESNKYLEEIRENAEEILKDLKLPYRVVQVCTGDMGAGKIKMYDIETWMPSRNEYSETHSASNLGDWQARRLNIKYKTKTGEKKYVHTLNNTAIASPRILIPILEIYQQKNGEVKVPKVLRPFLRKRIIKPKE